MGGLLNCSLLIWVMSSLADFRPCPDRILLWWMNPFICICWPCTGPTIYLHNYGASPWNIPGELSGSGAWCWRLFSGAALLACFNYSLTSEKVLCWIILSNYKKDQLSYQGFSDCHSSRYNELEHLCEFVKLIEYDCEMITSRCFSWAASSFGELERVQER